MSDRGLPDDDPGLPDFEELIQKAERKDARGGAAGQGATARGADGGTDGPHPSPLPEGEGARGTGLSAAIAASRERAAAKETSEVAAGERAAPARPISPTRAMAVYLTQLRQLVTEATESRRAWVRQIGIMMQDARNRPIGMVTPTAAKIGAEQLSRFGELRERLAKLEPAPGCADLQMLMHGWLDRHMEVCQILIDFGRTSDVGKLRASQGLLAEGRADLQRFQTAYAKQVATLKRQVDAAKKRKKTKWPFGRPKAS